MMTKEECEKYLAKLNELIERDNVHSDIKRDFRTLRSAINMVLELPRNKEDVYGYDELHKIP